ncbi:MAG: tetratricopeptide repeat protein [Planctomycetota bacterium]|jgi:hypothetical protein
MHLFQVSLLLLALAPVTGVEWSELAQRLQAGDADAHGDLRIYAASHEKAEAWLLLAQMDRRAGDYAAALSHARQTLVTARDQGLHDDTLTADATAIAIDAANRSDRTDLAEKIFSRYDTKADPHGRVHYRAAQTALRDGNFTISSERISKAQRLVGDVPVAYLVHQARIHEHRANTVSTDDEHQRELAAALVLYRQANKGSTSSADLLYNLGRCLRLTARGDHAILEEAAAVQAQARALRGADPYVDIELALIRLAQGDLVAANSGLSTALTSIGADNDPRVAGIYRARGSVRTRLHQEHGDRYPINEAIDDLTQAAALGDDSAELYNNLLAAHLLADTRDEHAINRLISQHADKLDPLNTGLSLLAGVSANPDPAQADQALGAAKMLANGLAVDHDQTEAWVDDDPSMRAMWRSLGHAYRLHHQLSGGNQGSLARAYRAYQIAGALGDRYAHDHYLALAASDDPSVAYRAATDVLGWRSYAHGDALRLALANYGASKRWRHPLHALFWFGGVIALLALGLRSHLTAGRGGANPSQDRERTPANGNPVNDSLGNARARSGPQAATSPAQGATYQRQRSPARGAANQRQPSAGKGVAPQRPAAKSKPLAPAPAQGGYQRQPSQAAGGYQRQPTAAEITAEKRRAIAQRAQQQQRRGG